MATRKTAEFAQMDEVKLTIHDLEWEDLIEALQKGFDDFKAMPSHVLMLVIIYPIVGLVLGRMAFGYDILPLLFPIISGFALIGPVAAVGLYELSRRRELGMEVRWKHAFAPFKSASFGAILALGVLQMIIYFVWLAAALSIYWLTFGTAVPTSIPGFAYEILTTSAGWTLIIVGGGVGFVFALTVLIVSVVSFPMLLDRDVGAEVAIKTSARAVFENPVMMSIWGIFVAGLLAIGMVPLFIGLAVVMPVLGHSTWHLYRKVVKY